MKPKSSSPPRLIPDPASFRDPDGQVYYYRGQLLRQINQSYLSTFKRFISSGLYQTLVTNQLIIPHHQVNYPPLSSDAALVVQPERLIPLITYPYEWSFGQLKAAALTTLQVARYCLDHQFMLKDANAYNIQFLDGQAVLIDRLSFTPLKPHQPWPAYRQFCQHFLAPLALMAYTDIRLHKLLRVYLEGIPLDLASRLLPKTTHLQPSLLTHIHLHSLSQQLTKQRESKTYRLKSNFSRASHYGLIDSLIQVISRLSWRQPPYQTVWASYYQATNYSSKSFQAKRQQLSSWLDQLKPKTVWDIGANDGTFSRLSTQRRVFTIALDIDPGAVEQNYQTSVKLQDPYMLPLIIDLFNPSPSIGWSNAERPALFTRGQPDLVLALALTHHLALTNHLPFEKIASFFAQLTPSLIIEYVSPKDSQAQRLMLQRQAVFAHYNQTNFEASFQLFFKLQAKVKLPQSLRTLYLYQRR